MRTGQARPDDKPRLTLGEVLGMLDDVTGADGKYMARCPVHDDKKSSMRVRQGDNGGVLLKCFAGCATEDIVRALGIEMYQLTPDKDDGRRSNPPPKPPAKGKPIKESFVVGGDYRRKTKDENNRDVWVAEKITAIYDYQDAGGAVVVRVARTEEKSFPVHHLDGDTWRWGRGPYDGLLYHMPEIIKAIGDGQPVYLVEGEKDADNLMALGYCATTVMGGGGKGKWHENATEALRGARVYILPDNDEPGRIHAREVAAALNGVAASARMIDLAEDMPEMPLKGDITDWLKAQGKKAAAKAAFDALVARTDAAPAPIAPAGPEKRDAERLFDGVPGYCVHDGCLCQWTNDAPIRLCTFVGAPVAQIMRDNGVDAEMHMRVAGWDRRGNELPEITMTSAEFAAMNWPIKRWGAAGNIAPGSTSRGKVLWAMNLCADMRARRETVYTHTGWRQIDGEWAYLHRGGAVGAENVSVDLGGSMSTYDLSCPDDLDMYEACASSLALLSVAPMHITVPLLGLMYLAPLYSALDAVGHAPTFVLYLNGISGSMKSTIAALALSHFGKFERTNLPANFHDTTNAIRGKAFSAKDTVLLIDDYHPVASAMEKRHMDEVAQGMIRAYGDRADRGRMDVDLNVRSPMPPRGVGMMTGEDLPNAGASGLARLYIVDVGKDDIELGPGLDAMQAAARAGMMRRAMVGYIDWLREQMDELPGKLAEEYAELRARATARLGGNHKRVPEMVAHLMLGMEMMIEYMEVTGAVSKDMAGWHLDEAWRELTVGSAAQAEAAAEDRPSAMFIRAVAQMASTGGAGFAYRGPIEESKHVENMVGWRDLDFYYLLPDVCYGAVCKMYAQQGVQFPISVNALKKQLREDGCVEPDARGKATKSMRFDGRQVRVLVVPRARVDGTGGQ